LLVEKGVLTKEEFLETIKTVDIEMRITIRGLESKHIT